MLPSKKVPHYHNILELDTNGRPLATISAKRANWYLQKGLAVAVAPPPGYPGCIQLTFKAKGGPAPPSCRIRDNICVVCGTASQLTLHHIIPRVISRCFPPEDKEHQSQYCVLLCQEHHLAAEKLNQPHLTGNPLWKECQPQLRVIGNKSFNALWTLHSSGQLERLQHSHPRRVLELYQKAGLPHLPQSRREWAEIADRRQKRVFDHPLSPFGSQFISLHGGIDPVRRLFWNLFLQLNPQFI